MTESKKVIVIAEAGVNHNGDLSLAKALIQAGADAGADIVKFQTFKTDLLVTPDARQADYQTANSGKTESQQKMLKRLELDRNAHDILLAHCRSSGVQFLSTAFDDESVDLLASYGLPFWKIPSGEITNLRYLRRIGELQSQVILSTGMSTLGEIEVALATLVRAGTRQDNITVLHCTTEYPTPWNEVNLRAMVTIRDAFHISVGYSDHTAGIEVATAAVALGATIIEKHFTLDRNLPGPDHKASLVPKELASMVSAIRNIELALGDGIKRPTPSEEKNRLVARKSLVASKTIQKGEVFTLDSFWIKRPGTGLSPALLEHLLGRPAARDFHENELIEF